MGGGAPSEELVGTVSTFAWVGEGKELTGTASSATGADEGSIGNSSSASGADEGSTEFLPSSAGVGVGSTGDCCAASDLVEKSERGGHSTEETVVGAARVV